jgi:hypothetical protein
MLATLLLLPTPASAQLIERNELPPLPGAAPPDLGPQRPSPLAPPGLTMPPGPGPRTTGPETAASPLPPDLWRGVDAESLDKLLAAAPLPSPSATLASLIARVLAAGNEPQGEDLVLRARALEKSGRIDEVDTLLRHAGEMDDPRMLGRYAVALLALGREDEACEIKTGGAPGAPGDRETLLVAVYCAAAKGDLPGAKLALQLARDQGTDVRLAAAALAGLEKAPIKQPALPKSLGVIDYLFLSLGDDRPSAGLAAKAEPELLFMLARDDTAPAELRVGAAERAASLNIVDGKDLACAYREAATALRKNAQSPPALRARLFSAFDNAPSAKIRAESIEALLASARDQGIEVPIADALAEASAGLVDDRAAAFAETGVRVAALAGDEETAWAWIDAGGERLQAWQLLLAVSDPQEPRAEAALAQGVELGLKGGLPPPMLHRLVSVLDALNYDVPIPLWDEAGKTPQPSDGDLPATGALTSLKEAADAGEIGRTVLIAAAVLGPNGPKGAHLIALGDAIRALKRVGLEAEARRIGFEALYAHWPLSGKA